jgi:hypothetical protein
MRLKAERALLGRRPVWVLLGALAGPRSPLGTVRAVLRSEITALYRGAEPCLPLLSAGRKSGMNMHWNSGCVHSL